MSDNKISSSEKSNEDLAMDISENASGKLSNQRPETKGLQGATYKRIVGRKVRDRIRKIEHRTRAISVVGLELLPT